MEIELNSQLFRRCMLVCCHLWSRTHYSCMWWVKCTDGCTGGTRTGCDRSLFCTPGRWGETNTWLQVSLSGIEGHAIVPCRVVLCILIGDTWGHELMYAWGGKVHMLFYHQVKDISCTIRKKWDDAYTACINLADSLSMRIPPCALLLMRLLVCCMEYFSISPTM